MEFTTHMLFMLHGGSAQYYGPYDSKKLKAFETEKARLISLLRPSTVTTLYFHGEDLLETEHEDASGY